MRSSSLQLTPDGPAVSRLTLGLWRLLEWGVDAAGLLELVEQCLELGVTTFDHADLYGDFACEERFGDALGRRPELRDRLQLVTKCGIQPVSKQRPGNAVKHYDTTAAHLVESVERSLRRLRTDRIDLLLIHRPDPLMDADEVARTFEKLRQDGKVLHFGVSNFLPSQFELLASRMASGLVTNQLEISILRPEALFDGSLDHCQRRRIAPMAWSPLGGGRLFRGSDERSARVRRRLAEIGETLGGAGVDQIALAWLLAHPANIVPVLGSGKIERIRAAVEAQALHLTRQQWFSVLEASTGSPVP